MTPHRSSDTLLKVTTLDEGSAVLVDFLAQQGIIPEHLRQRVSLRGGDEARETLKELVSSSDVDPDELAEALSEFSDVPYIFLRQLPAISPEIISLIPPEIIGEHGVLPLGFDLQETLFVGCLNPLDRDGLRLVSFFSASRVEPVVISATDMAWALEQSFGSAWHKSWAELLGRHREMLDVMLEADAIRNAAETTAEAETAKRRSGQRFRERIAGAMKRGLTNAMVPLRRGEQATVTQGLQRYFEPTDRAPVTPIGGQSAVGDVDIQLAFRHASRPEGYERVSSGAYALAERASAKPRLEGFFGSIEAMLRRSRETHEIADAAFELAASSCLASEKTPVFYRELVESLGAAYPISTVWFVRGDRLLLVAAESDVADMSPVVGTEFERGTEGPWDRVVRTGLAYRGRLTKRDPVSRWLREQDAHHICILPVFVSSRLVALLGLGTTETRSMVLPNLPTYLRLDQVLSAEYSAGASCLRSHQITAAHES